MKTKSYSWVMSLYLTLWHGLRTLGCPCMIVNDRTLGCPCMIVNQEQRSVRVSFVLRCLSTVGNLVDLHRYNQNHWNRGFDNQNVRGIGKEQTGEASSTSVREVVWVQMSCNEGWNSCIGREPDEVQWQITDLWWQSSLHPMMMTHTGNTSTLRW
jgi:hypothetical protein